MTARNAGYAYNHVARAVSERKRIVGGIIACKLQSVNVSAFRSRSLSFGTSKYFGILLIDFGNSQSLRERGVVNNALGRTVSYKLLANNAYDNVLRINNQLAGSGSDIVPAVGGISLLSFVYCAVIFDKNSVGVKYVCAVIVFDVFGQEVSGNGISTRIYGLQSFCSVNISVSNYNPAFGNCGVLCCRNGMSVSVVLHVGNRGYRNRYVGRIDCQRAVQNLRLIIFGAYGSFNIVNSYVCGQTVQRFAGIARIGEIFVLDRIIIVCQHYFHGYGVAVVVSRNLVVPAVEVIVGKRTHNNAERGVLVNESIVSGFSARNNNLVSTEIHAALSISVLENSRGQRRKNRLRFAVDESGYLDSRL